MCISCGTIFWSMCSLKVSASLKKTNFHSPSNHQLLIAPLTGWNSMRFLLIHAGILAGLVLWNFCAWVPASVSSYVQLNMLSCQEWYLNVDIYFVQLLHSTFFHNDLWVWGEMRKNKDVSFRAEHFTVSHSLNVE